MFTASPPPGNIAGTLEALRQLQARPALRQQLNDRGRQFHAGLAALGFDLGPEPSPVVSVILSEPQAAIEFWKRLLDAGLYTNVSLPPATPKSLSLLRSSVSAAHSAEQIDHALGLFAEVGQMMGLISVAPKAARRAAGRIA
jgi:8-amino-7-oxononanoate synthase